MGRKRSNGKRTGRHPINALTDRRVRQEKVPGFYADGNGLYLRVDPSGGRRWVARLMVRGTGERHDYGLGGYPTITLAMAREKVLEFKRQAREGIDPSEERRKAADERRKAAEAQQKKAEHTFKKIAEQHHSSKSAGWSNPKHAAQWLKSLQDHAFPIIGEMPVGEIDTDAVLKVLKPIWDTKPTTAARVRGRIETVLDAAKVMKMRDGENPAAWRNHLELILAAPGKVRETEHRPALDWRKLPAFMTELSKREETAAKALAFTVLTVARSGEIRRMTWGEIDDDVWIVPARHMKGRKEHRVPLTAAALALMGERGEPGKLVFPSSKGQLSLSDTTLMEVLRAIGMGDVTVHGFRSTFRDWAGESTHHPREVIEAALAHQLKDKSEAAYARGDLFQKRRALMEDWTAYATGTTGKVIPISSRRKRA